MMEGTYHYPPDVLDLLVDTIPSLVRGKKDVLVFLRGCGVAPGDLSDLRARVDKKEQVSKFEIVRTVLVRLNERGDAALRQRREIIRRVVEFEDFSTCWPDDQLKAKGLVAEVQRIVGAKDTFTRIADEREREAAQVRETKRREQDELRERNRRREELHRRLSGLFGLSDPHRRGALLETLLNDIFREYGVQVSESFRRSGSDIGGTLEQIDGAIRLDGDIYLVEAKWTQEALGTGEIGPHLVRAHHREPARAVFVSGSGYTAPAISTCRDALGKAIVVLCTLQEFVAAFEAQADIKEMLEMKVREAQLNRNPFAPFVP